jgi:hypothetical protein
MPKIRYYTVTQTREVKVSADSPTEATILADRLFRGIKKPEDQLHVQSAIVEIEISARENY